MNAIEVTSYNSGTGASTINTVSGRAEAQAAFDEGTGLNARDIRVVDAKPWKGGALVCFEDGESAYFPGFLLHAARGLAAVLEMQAEGLDEDEPAMGE